MAIDWDEIAKAGGIPKGPSRFQAKQQQRAEEAAAMRTCYRAVDRRDGLTCRLCKRACASDAVAMLDKAHHHHLTYRSQGGDHDTRNVVRICASCHHAIHRCEIRVEGDADQRDPLSRKLNGISVAKRTEAGYVIEKWC